ncbi:PIN domain-containing protein [Agrobacterium vitis]|uniref:Ribonuclease VapC n=1 Tax=Agrobacterium vitis TaxID=373 RepID=A0A6L6VHX8_AGRVI|nr:type II toxin-antitoxin system VapC family toxin [Agrobacterium vitis]MUZ75430.1 PIN domain-containing protein [Agrobacterium vitis]
MIVVDSSVVIAIFEEEEDAATFAAVIASGEGLAMSAVNVHETATVLYARRGTENVGDFWRFLNASNIEIALFDADQARAASEAYLRYGKGFHSKAKLNLADCAAYALAKSLSAPLLFKGNDFTHTDVEQWR